MYHKTTNLQVAVDYCKIYPEYVVQTHTGPVPITSVSLSPYGPYLLDSMGCVLVSSISSESHNHSAPSSMKFLVLWEEESDEDLQLDSPSPCIMCDCEFLHRLPSAADERYSDDNWTRHHSISIADFNFITCSWDSFPPVELPCTASVWECLPRLVVFCFVMFGCCLIEACSFLKGKGKGVDQEGGREKWRDGKLCEDVSYEIKICTQKIKERREASKNGKKRSLYLVLL